MIDIFRLPDGTIPVRTTMISCTHIFDKHGICLGCGAREGSKEAEELERKANEPYQDR